MAALVIEALEDAGRPLSVGELAEEVEKRGYRHETRPKSPRQLRASISALPHKGIGIRRVGRGVYALTRPQSRRAPKRGGR
jgi:repressor of nif and glnA expression